MASTIVPELLERGNYERWSIFMKNYLVSQDLWAVTHHLSTPLGVSKKEWRKKNAAALHAIQISCGAEKFDQIKKMRSAFEAWAELKTINNAEHEEGEGGGGGGEEEEEEEEEETPEINPVSDLPEEQGLPQEQTPEINSGNDLSEEQSLPQEQGFQTMERPQSLIVQNAIDKGDVNVAMDLIQINPGALCSGYPPLHYATIVGKSNIVEALLESTPATQRDEWGNTALRLAAQFGNEEIARYFVSRDPSLLSMEDDGENIPVVVACRQGHKEVTNFLYSRTPFEILLRDEDKQVRRLLGWCFFSQRFDIMYDVLCHDPSLIVRLWEGLLESFAVTPTAFSSGSGLTFWQRWIYECFNIYILGNWADVTINHEERNFEVPLPGRLWRLASFLLPFLGIKQIHALKLRHDFANASLSLICEHLTNLHLRWRDTTRLRGALTSAIENGSDEFLIKVIKTNPDLLLVFGLKSTGDSTTSGDYLVDGAACGDYLVDGAACGNYLIDAVAFRREKIARFLIGLPLGKILIGTHDSQNNSILHMVGKMPFKSQLSSISGAALQMQREMQWFKEVESLLSQLGKDAKNNNKKTAYQVLAKDHKILLKQAEDWMKGLANSYIIVGALIITIMFAAAFTLPGGNDEQEGFPLFKNKAAFMLYIICDAISLFAAVAAVIIFLGFLTSRYKMEDFIKSIPRKLMVGLSTLFISLAAMMTAFCLALLLTFENQWWIIIPSLLLGSIPVSLFARLQFPLLREIYVLTYRSPISIRRDPCQAK